MKDPIFNAARLMILAKIDSKNNFLKEEIKQEPFGNENIENKRELIVLVGPPAVGKSTYIANKFKPEEVIIVSRDDIAEEISLANGLTYDDLFIVPPSNSIIGDLVPNMEKFGAIVKAPSSTPWTSVMFEKILQINVSINQALFDRFAQAFNSNKNIVVDMTNMGPGARRKILNRIPRSIKNSLFKRAVVFQLSDSNLPELLKRAEKREELARKSGRVKTVPVNVIMDMIKNFQAISPEEGFDKVDSLSTFTHSPE